MLTVIFYCGLMSFIVSARPINDTSTTDATASNNSDTRLVTEKSNETSNADHARKDCFLEMEENDIKNVVKHTEDDLVNIVDFHLIFTGTNQNDKLFEDMQIVTLVGREILLILDKKFYNFAASALNAGRAKVNVHLKNVSSTKCTKEKVAVCILEQIIVRNENPRNYEVCYEKTVITFERRNRRMCCRIFKTDVATNFNHECSERDSFLKKSRYLIILTILMMSTLTFYVLRVLCMLLCHSFFTIIHPRYYKLQESTMSLTSIFVKIVWGKSNFLSIWLSFFRTLVVLGALCTNIYFVVVFLSNLPSSPSTVFIHIVIMMSIYMVVGNGQAIVDSYFANRLLKRSEIESGLITVSSFPFLFDKAHIAFIPFICVIYFFSTPLALIVAVRLVYVRNIAVCESPNSSCRRLPVFFLVVHTLVVIAFIIFQLPTYLMLTYVLQFFLLGLFLNLTYFLPYLAAISVFTLYSYDIWKPLEEKYFLLKLIIHEECQSKKPDRKHETLRENVKLQSVVPKEIYDRIRKKLLPYDKNLFWVVLKLLWLLVISFGVVEVVRMLHSFNTSDAVKVLVTASVGILPHIFNKISRNAEGEGRKEAWKKELKENVKRLVNEIPNNKIILSLRMRTRSQNNTDKNAKPENNENAEPENVENGEPQNDENDESQNDENDEPQNVENDESQNDENDEPQNVENDEPQNVESDESQNVENDEPQNDENDEPQNDENDEPQNVENDEPQNVESDESQNVENEEPQNDENDEPQNVESDESQNVENDEPQNVENDEPQNVESDEPQNVENDKPQNDENDEPQNVENDEPQNVENDEPQNVENDEPQNVESDESQNVENDEPQNDENDEPQNVENDEPQNVENDEPQNDENDEPQNVENDEPQNVESDESQNVENDEPQNDENDEPQNVESDESQNVENDEPQNVENDEPQNVESDKSQSDENDKSQTDENDESQNDENDKPQSDENDESQNNENDKSQISDTDESQDDEYDEHTRLLICDKDKDIQNGIGYVLNFFMNNVIF